MNYIEYIKENEGTYESIINDKDFPNELKKIDKENKIIKVSIDGIIIEDYKWILNYNDDSWINEYCKRLKKHEGIKIR